MNVKLYNVFARAFLVFLSLFLLCSLSGYSIDDHTGSLKGSVTTSDNRPAAFVNIQIKGTTKGATTDEKGLFEFKKLNAGTYVLQVSLMGFQTIEKEATIVDGQSSTINFQLSASDKQLQEVVITTNRNKFAQKESDVVARLPLKNIENPQVYNVVNAKMIKEQVLTSFDDALQDGAGVASGGSNPGTRSGSYLRGFAEQAFFRNGKMLGTWTENDMANIDHIEILKGPSGTLYGGHGRTSYGGVVDRITKKPYNGFGGEVSLIAGNYGYNRFTADINTPLNKDSSLLGRFNGAYRKETSFRDYGFAESFFIAPSFTYKASDRLTINIDGEMFKVKGADKAFFDISSDAGITNVNQLNSLHDLSFSSNEIEYHKQTSVFTAEAIYKINDHWTSTTSYAFSHSDYDYPYASITIGKDTMITRSLGTANYDIDFTNIQQNFNGDFKIGKLRNRIVAGLDYLRDNEIYTGGGVGYDSFNYSQVAPYISASQYSAAMNVAGWTGGYVNDRYSAYVSDVLDLTPRLHAMASVRYEYSKSVTPSATKPDAKDPDNSYNQGAWTPKLGLVYEILDKQLSVFGNYMGGTQNVGPLLTNDGSGNGKTIKAKPETARQWEGGIKSDLFDHKLSVTASYYNISVDNKVRTDPSNINFSLQNGTEAHKGFELELFSNPIAGFNIMAGYGYLDAKFVSGTDEGKVPSFAPKSTANYWVSYTITSGKAKGLGLGTGANYRSNTFLTSENTVIIPSAFVVGASLFYEQARYRIAAKMDNLTNKVYWGDYLNSQAPRTVKIALTVNF